MIRQTIKQALCVIIVSSGVVSSVFAMEEPPKVLMRPNHLDLSRVPIGDPDGDAVSEVFPAPSDMLKYHDTLQRFVLLSLTKIQANSPKDSPIGSRPGTPKVGTPLGYITPKNGQDPFGSPIAQSTPIPGSPTPYCEHNTQVVIEEAEESKKLSTRARVIGKANLFFSADVIDKSVDRMFLSSIGAINWIEFPKEKTYAIASCESSYRDMTKKPSDIKLIQKGFEAKLTNFVKNEMSKKGYTENK